MRSLAIVAAINAVDPDLGPDRCPRRRPVGAATAARCRPLGHDVLGPVSDSALPRRRRGHRDRVAHHPVADRRAATPNARWATLVHPDATVGPDVVLGPGTVIAPGARLSTAIRGGRHLQVDQNATVGHDTVLGDYVRLNPQACVSGSVHHRRPLLVGAGAVVLEGRTDRGRRRRRRRSRGDEGRAGRRHRRQGCAGTMRVAFVSQWFPPERGTAVAESIATGLAALGHDVDVLTGFPNYPTGVLYDGWTQRPYVHEHLTDRVDVHRTPSTRATTPGLCDGWRTTSVMRPRPPSSPPTGSTDPMPGSCTPRLPPPLSRPSSPDPGVARRRAC